MPPVTVSLTVSCTRRNVPSRNSLTASVNFRKTTWKRLRGPGHCVATACATRGQVSTCPQSDSGTNLGRRQCSLWRSSGRTVCDFIAFLRRCRPRPMMTHAMSASSQANTVGQQTAVLEPAPANSQSTRISCNSTRSKDSEEVNPRRPVCTSSENPAPLFTASSFSGLGSIYGASTSK